MEKLQKTKRFPKFLNCFHFECFCHLLDYNNCKTIIRKKPFTFEMLQVWQRSKPCHRRQLFSTLFAQKQLRKTHLLLQTHADTLIHSHTHTHTETGHNFNFIDKESWKSSHTQRIDKYVCWCEDQMSSDKKELSKPIYL